MPAAFMVAVGIHFLSLDRVVGGGLRGGGWRELMRGEADLKGRGEDTRAGYTRSRQDMVSRASV